MIEYILLLSAIIYIFYYLLIIVKSPYIYYSDELKDILSDMDINKKIYWSFFAFNNYIQYMVFIIISSVNSYKGDNIYNTRIINFRDNEQTILAEGILNDNPKGILLILHTVFGNYLDSCNDLNKICNELNFKLVSYSRRGHSLNLYKPKFNSVGHQEDLADIISIIKNKYTNTPIYIIGLSAGSSLLARYLGNNKHDNTIKGAILISPGYNFKKAIKTMPWICNKLLVNKAKNFFLKKNKILLKHYNKNAYNALIKSKSMNDWHNNQYHFVNEYNNIDEYYYDHDPVHVLEKISIPILYLNALDDMIFTKDLVLEYKELVKKSKNKIIIHTNRGSHCAFFTGIFLTSWSFEVSKKFIQSLIKKNY